MNEEDFITKFYSCDNEEQFLKDICHNLNCLQKVQNNWNELKKYISAEWYCFDNESVEFEVARKIMKKAQELEQGKDENN